MTWCPRAVRLTLISEGFEHNFEANAFFYDRQVAERIKNVFLHDQTQCVLLTTKVLSRSRRQPFTRRLWQSIIRLFSPLL